ncbi:hypothetical protein PsorP6_015476 [Peronosclerospora sorghi]|uniref:Uncharacterized protein n=1 Tax=Peronosclerospora sorghi TaxID=230839 RepID=A0ACC0WP59_9STRA|nr:hypothetical protein PsorP6_015476 [Peronosclerospora sorghi]
MLQFFIQLAYPLIIYIGEHWRLSPLQQSGAKDRYAALEFLANLATIPYELVHPYRDSVLRKLFLVMDDRKCPRMPDDVKENGTLPPRGRSCPSR